MSPLARNIEDY